MSGLVEQSPSISMSIKATTSPAPATAASAPESQMAAEAHESPPKLNNMNVVITSLIAGAIAGALAKTAIAPLDRAKINFQINKETPYTFRGATLFLKRAFEKEGFLSLWRGNSATMARIIPYAAIQFTAHEQYKKLLKVDQDKSTNIRRFVAGSLAGITSQSMTYPLDLARARMAVTDKYTGYRTLRQVFVTICRDEGPRTLFRGYWPTVLGVIPYAGMSFFTYETLKREYTAVTGEKKPNTLFSLMFGAAAGVIGQTSSYPLDIVRRRMQTIGINGRTDQYSTIISTLQKIYREEGIKNGFFKGLSMNWIKGPIAVGISFSTYDFIKEVLREIVGLQTDAKE
ncbi:mitochondrial coenzyme A transporter SLC25A42 [Phlebotomus papatasi]|uniref:mitochondrial coenzyme A transporter SLC25A42 n=1 Tax=Phlebotomus papatasi TaxID=29031 RepID=UPI002483DB21|nr:mitochondrial coenzyme A transporter SLC25A42 [Phlebotomus papatasi]XP_055697120.1 mitochondrial coenzyme A transporter SLC25A42 [Phlebotomus papatasi]XP_055697121.1 mitochondrial coenzyme A transporter SLC25A42 [Phlebotomus papatasi]XP_055697122.1 mitochondrial coenzyme A transporter SLC25A42 [Phlebotomus papatasi]